MAQLRNPKLSMVLLLTQILSYTIAQDGNSVRVAIPINCSDRFLNSSRILATNCLDSNEVQRADTIFANHTISEPELNASQSLGANELINSTASPSSVKQSGNRGGRSVCRISEFSCVRAKKCIPSDKFCNGIDDCGGGDTSDEPRFCTPCNRTYYGEWGSTYSLSLSSQTISGVQPGILPSANTAGGKKAQSYFVCQLTFAAAGDNFGDLVQIIFDSINIGDLTSSNFDGCPSGSLQVAEISRPITGGHWCGSGSGYSVYFSEMSAVALTLSIGNLKAPEPQGEKEEKASSKGEKSTVPSIFTPPFDFDFKIRYKFIPRSVAVVRYGLMGNVVERGELVPGSYCSRVLDSCHRKRCRIQSPNYPGLYPRNVSCFYTIRHRESPPGKRVLIQIVQMKPHKVQLRSIPGRLAGSSGPPGPDSPNLDSFITWEDCTGNRDSLVIYDGMTTNDPVLLKICGGSYIPPITSSGPGILVVFSSTPYGNPLDPKPSPPLPIPLRGFELEVNVVIVDSGMADYTNVKECSFVFISSRDGEWPGFKAQEHGGNWIIGKMGSVSNPKHTLSPNTTCRYEFKGSKSEAIWIYFVSYRRSLIKDSKDVDGNCTTRLRILDGISSRNDVLLGAYCDNDLPRLCDHKALENETRLVRACTTNESYISAGSRLIIEQQLLEGTALRPLHYLFHYEFVNRHTGSDGCSREFYSQKIKPRGYFTTSQNIFDFGRGGRKNLTCTYTFHLQSYESLRLTVINSSFGERPCQSKIDFETGRHTCNYNFHNNGSSNVTSGPLSEIRLYELIWPGSNITTHETCLCGNSTREYAFTFLGRKIQLKFTVENMRGEDSYEHFFTHFEYDIRRGTGCRGDNHYMRTDSGMISMESSTIHGIREKQVSCDHYPWLLEARENHSLYLRIPGMAMLEETGTKPKVRGNSTTTTSTESPASRIFERGCPKTKNRIFVYDQNNKLVQKICPSSNANSMARKSGQTVEIYSEDFTQYNSPLYPFSPSKFVVEFVGKESGTYRIHWLELMSAKMKAALNIAEHGEKETFNSSRRGGLWDEETLAMFEDEVRDTNSVHLVSGEVSERKVCSSFCPELNACISEKLWCDGEVHCPISLADEKSCDSFWLTMGQLMSPAVYVPIAAAVASATFCCLLVVLCLGVKKVVMNSRGKASGRSSACSTLESKRRVPIPPPRDMPFDPHDSVS